MNHDLILSNCFEINYHTTLNQTIQPNKGFFGTQSFMNKQFKHIFWTFACYNGHKCNENLMYMNY